MPTSQPTSSTLFKDCYNKTYLAELSDRLEDAWADFDRTAFGGAVFDDRWADRELKERMRHIAVCLRDALPGEYREAVRIICDASWAGRGLENMALLDFVEQFGLDDWEASLPALSHLTRHASAEFAVRPFILRDPDRMMRQMRAWAEDDNEHVRRLASEGCRPRLPWAQALPIFKKDPAPVLEVLEHLRADDSEYVRRSVANNLNDISKDHPDRVLRIARHWLGDNAQTDWIVKHACRTLLKSGRPEALELFGYAPADHVTLSGLTIKHNPVRIGGDLEFAFELRTEATSLGKLRVEFVIDYMKANGKRAPKLFMIGQGEYKQRERRIEKKHSFQPRTTRKLYPGRHELAIVVNGDEKGRAGFEVAG
ncbi:MAG: DNA alkylation repair protein [Planctomycetota bacterium]